MFKFLLKQFLLFWLLIETFRTIFVIYYWDKLQVSTSVLKDIFSAYMHAISLDIATASFLIIIPWFMLFFNAFLRIKFMKRLLFFYTYTIIILSSFVYIAELGIYNEWEEKPSAKILSYLKHPDEAIASNPLGYTIILLMILSVVLFLFYKLTKKVVQSYDVTQKIHYKKAALFVLLVPLIFLGARGGWAQIPISQSTVYFSKHKVYNDLAISSFYNFLHSIIEDQAVVNGHNPYLTNFSKEQKESTLKTYMATPKGCERESILTTKRPNIVLIIWESLSGDFIKNDKYKEAIPNLMRLSKEGILFTKAYASATLSHEGIPSILSGWPAIYDTYITNLPSKFNKLPFLTKKLKHEGYASSFLFGGQLRYGNLTAYIYGNTFDTIEEHSDIDLDSSKDGSLGYHDEYMLDYFRKKTNRLKEPFFSVIFTLSSHSPYDQPMEDVINWGGYDKGYINSVYYSDKSIAKFLEDAKKEPWYKHTLFIISADHSHHTPRAWSRADKNWHHIPILFYGEVIKKQYRGKNIDKIISQRDIAATLLSQLNIDHSDFLWSRDVFCKEYQENAYIMTRDGFGLITNQGSLTYNIKEKRVLYHEGNTSGLKEDGHIYMEHLLQTYLDY